MVKLTQAVETACHDNAGIKGYVPERVTYVTCKKLKYSLRCDEEYQPDFGISMNASKISKNGASRFSR